MHRTAQTGFTLIELVMVIVIIGILAAMAAPRMSLTDSSVHAQAAQIARDIRHAQMLAMTQGRTLTFQSLGGSYRCTDSTSTVITDPATQQPFTFTLNNGVTLTVASVNFDSLGRPVSGGALRSTAVDFTVSGGAQSAALSVSPVTGFVAVMP
ncbi:MAG: type II secretion system protein [Gammaproteobacteria bacterium]|nr:type II secretion system protein [Gammaproteobacteria bacterium]